MVQDFVHQQYVPMIFALNFIDLRNPQPCSKILRTEIRTTMSTSNPRAGHFKKPWAKILRLKKWGSHKNPISFSCCFAAKKQLRMSLEHFWGFLIWVHIMTMWHRGILLIAQGTSFRFLSCNQVMSEKWRWKMAGTQLLWRASFVVHELVSQPHLLGKFHPTSTTQKCENL